jgi:lysophospholipase L1-like esterase
MSSTRREFMALAAAMIAADATPAFGAEVRPEPAAGRPGSPATTILFQGDSITDCSRDRSVAGANDPRALGTGYPFLLASALRERHPARDLQILNRGVSGNTVTDLVARWDRDTLEIKPDVLSILIGVNDIWHTLTGGYAGTPEKYAAGYHDLVQRTRTALPGVKLVILEPFVLRTGAVSDAWFPAFDKFRAGARTVAKSAGATFIPLHDMFQDLARKSSPAYWAADGVHPTIAGHEAIARRWQAAVSL